MVLVAPVLQAMCYKHQCKKHIASGTICYGLSDISIGHSGKVFRVLCPKISTGQKKLAPTGWHGRHVFATLAANNGVFPKGSLIATLPPCARASATPEEL